MIGLCSVAKVLELVTLMITLHYVRLLVSQLGENSTGFEEAAYWEKACAWATWRGTAGPPGAGSNLRLTACNEMGISVLQPQVTVLPPTVEEDPKPCKADSLADALLAAS